MVKHLALVVERLNGTIHWINLYLMDNAICFVTPIHWIGIFTFFLEGTVTNPAIWLVLNAVFTLVDKRPKNRLQLILIGHRKYLES